MIDGWGGAALADAVNPHWHRDGIIVTAIAMTVAMFWRGR